MITLLLGHYELGLVAFLFIFCKLILLVIAEFLLLLIVGIFDVGKDVGVESSFPGIRKDVSVLGIIDDIHVLRATRLDRVPQISGDNVVHLYSLQ